MAHTSTRHSPEPRSAQRVRRYRIDPARSQLQFVTRHLFGLGTVHGSFPIRSGEIVVDDGRRASVTARIAATGFHTGNSGRDGAVLSERFLDAERFPDIVFTATGVNRGEASAVLPGRLTVRTVTNPVELTIHDLEITAEGIAATATVEIDRYAWGITAAKGMAGRRLRLTLTVHADPA